MKIPVLADASLPYLTTAFPAPFALTCYTCPEEVPARLSGQEILLCRASLPVTSSLLRGSTLRYVATASSGSDHIDTAALQQAGVSLLDARGCNAPAVADYLLATLAWLKTQNLVKGKKAGIIGLGAVGSLVNRRLQALGFTTCLYDPLKALREADFPHQGWEALLDCSLLCIHANLHDQSPYPSRHLLDASFLRALPPGTVIINAARGEIVDEAALLAYGSHLIYCTDVYANEPCINPRIVRKASLCTPHIAGHSLEAKRRAVRMVSEQLHTRYQLPLPQWPTQEETVHNAIITPHDWEKSVLAYYSPWNETGRIKQDPSPPVFLATRTQHTQRRELIWEGQEVAIGI